MLVASGLPTVLRVLAVYLYCLSALEAHQGAGQNLQVVC